MRASPRKVKDESVPAHDVPATVRSVAVTADGIVSFQDRPGS